MFTVAAAGSSQAEPSLDPAPAPIGIEANRAYACFQAHVSGLGWGPWSCDPNNAVGTTGQNRAIEALRIKIVNAGRYCAEAHLRNTGRQSPRCTTSGGIIEVGTTGENRPMEHIGISIDDVHTYPYDLEGWAHLQNFGWTYKKPAAERWGQLSLGTKGQARNLEAFSMGLVASGSIG